MRHLVVLCALVCCFILATAAVSEARSGCCSHHGGVCGCACCDGSPLSARCAPYYDCGGQEATPEPTPRPTPEPLPAEFQARVVGIQDGDTITVLYNQRQIRIRLDGIDCPEKRQAYGAAAKKFTASLVANQTVTVKVSGTDHYGRTLATIVLPDGRILNQELVRAGMA